MKKTLKFVAILIAIFGFLPTIASAEWWAKNAPQSLVTNDGSGFANADIHVAHCYIGIGNGTSCGSGGGGVVTSITGASGITATPNPIVSTGTVSINEAFANVWTALQTFNSQNNLTALNISAALTNTTAATGGATIQNSPALQFLGSAFVTGASQQQNFRVINEPTTVGPSLNFYGQIGVGGPVIKMASLLDDGVAAKLSVNRVQADGTVELANGGHLLFDGTVSGSVDFRAASTTTNYVLVLPNAQGGASTTLINNGSGDLTWGTPSGTVTTDSSLSGIGTVLTPLRIFPGNSNIWTPAAGTFFTQNSIATTPTTSIFAENSTLATLAVPQQISPALEFKGHMWTSGGGGSDHNGTFRIYQIPKNGTAAGTTTAGTLQIDSSKDGSYTTNIFSLDKAGNITNAGSITAATSISSTGGSISSNTSSVSAGTNLLAGATGVASGGLYLIGGTSGVLNITAPAVITSYGLTPPSAQATNDGQTEINDGTGVQSWKNVAAVYGFDRKVAQTSSVASVVASTVGASDSSYLISANVNVTTFATGTFNVTCAYTDETGAARTLTLNFSSVAGTLGIAVAGAGAFEGIPAHIRAQAGTTITLATSGTFTSLTYNVEGAITKIQ